tara:strand:+ start:509 stop:1987 length:1479 start_codon:yes stop_codon:yes gene_type:complete
MANRLPSFASEQAAPVQHWSEKEYTAQEDWDSNIGNYNRNTNPSDKYLSNYDGSYVGKPIGASVEQPVIGTDYIPTNQGVQDFIPKVVPPYVPDTYTYSNQGFTGVPDRTAESIKGLGPSLLQNIVDVGDDAWYMTGQLGESTSLPKLNLEEAVKASKGGRGSRGNRLADIETSKGGRGSRGKHWADDIIDWKGHPSAGVTYPEPPSSYDPRIDGMIKEVKGRDESVFTTIDDLVGRGGYTPEEIMAGTDKSDPFWMSQDGLTDTPVDLGLTDAQVEQILNPSISGESFIRDNPQYAPISLFDEPLDNGGTFAESNFVGPHDYAYGNIQDSSESLNPLPAYLPPPHQAAISHMLDRNNIDTRKPMNLSGYVNTPPQPEVYEAPKGVVDPRHMKDYYEMISQTSKLPAGASNMEPIFTGPQGTAPVDEIVDLSRDVVRQPWSHPSAGVSYPDPVGDEIADLNLQINQMKAMGQGGSQWVLDAERQRDILKANR